MYRFTLILAVLAGLELGGVAGIFVAIPVVAAMSVAWRHGLEWLDEPPETPRV
jgi:predicted PurR-regulated permease PerM